MAQNGHKHLMTHIVVFTQERKFNSLQKRLTRIVRDHREISIKNYHNGQFGVHVIRDNILLVSFLASQSIKSGVSIYFTCNQKNQHSTGSTHVNWLTSLNYFVNPMSPELGLLGMYEVCFGINEDTEFQSWGYPVFPKNYQLTEPSQIIYKIRLGRESNLRVNEDELTDLNVLVSKLHRNAKTKIWIYSKKNRVF